MHFSQTHSTHTLALTYRCARWLIKIFFDASLLEISIFVDISCPLLFKCRLFGEREMKYKTWWMLNRFSLSRWLSIEIPMIIVWRRKKQIFSMIVRLVLYWCMVRAVERRRKLIEGKMMSRARSKKSRHFFDAISGDVNCNCLSCPCITHNMSKFTRFIVELCKPQLEKLDELLLQPCHFVHNCRCWYSVRRVRSFFSVEPLFQPFTGPFRHNQIVAREMKRRSSLSTSYFIVFFRTPG